MEREHMRRAPPGLGELSDHSKNVQHPNPKNGSKQAETSRASMIEKLSNSWFRGSVELEPRQMKLSRRGSNSHVLRLKINESSHPRIVRHPGSGSNDLETSNDSVVRTPWITLLWKKGKTSTSRSEVLSVLLQSSACVRLAVSMRIATGRPD